MASEASVKVKADTKGLMGDLKGIAKGFTAVTKGLGTPVDLGLEAVGKSMIAYADLETSITRVNSVFGDASKFVTYFAENTANGLGMSEDSAYKYAATYGELFKNIATDSRENSKITIDMLEASAVMASKTGRTMDDVMGRIRSGLQGDAAAIKDLGIDISAAALESTEAFKSMADGRSWGELASYEQQQVTTLAVLEQAHSKFGDQVQKGSAFSLTAFAGAFQDLQGAAGQFLSAGLEPVIGGLTNLMDWATKGIKALATLFGLKSPTPENGGAIDKSGTGTVGASPFSGLEAPEFGEMDVGWLDAASEKIGEFKGLFDFTGIKESWASLKEALVPLGENIGSGLKWLWDNVLVPFGQWTINEALPAFFNALASALEFISPLLETVGSAFVWLWDNLLKPIAEWRGTRIVDELGKLGTVLSAIGAWISDNSENIRNWIVGIALVLGPAIVAQMAMTAATATWNLVCGFATTATTALGTVITSLTSPIGLIVLGIAALIEVGVLLYQNWDTIAAKAGELWEKIKTALEPLGEFFTRLWGGITDTFKGAINLLISGLNLLIRGLNRVSFDIPWWVPVIGGMKFGFNIPEIPKLAAGGAAYGQIAAIVGDNFNARQDPEVIAPLSSLKGMILEALLQKEIVAGDNRETRVTLTLENGETLVDLLIDPMNNKAKNLGYAPVFKPA